MSLQDLLQRSAPTREELEDLFIAQVTDKEAFENAEDQDAFQAVSAGLLATVIAIADSPILSWPESDNTICEMTAAAFNSRMLRYAKEKGHKPSKDDYIQEGRDAHDSLSDRQLPSQFSMPTKIAIRVGQIFGLRAARDTINWYKFNERGQSRS